MKSESHENIINALKKQKQTTYHNVDKQYIPAPDVWLHNEKWNDELIQRETKQDFNKAIEQTFKKTPTGLYIAFCSKCGNKEMPNDKWQLKEGSNCHRVDYLPQNPTLKAEKDNKATHTLHEEQDVGKIVNSLTAKLRMGG